MQALAGATEGLHLLVLYGSRARGENRDGSDWDFGYVADPSSDIGMFTAGLVQLVGTDAVDLVDLSTASALLRYRVAADGVVVHEDQRGGFVDFKVEAVRFWCDAGPVIAEAHRQVLEHLGSRA